MSTSETEEGETDYTPMLRDREAEFRRYQDLVADAPAYAGLLASIGRGYLETSERFEAGDLVTWKPFMRNQLMPIVGAPAVVVRYLDPVQEADPDGEAEELDIVLGVLDGNGTFRVFSFPSARFMRWEPSDEAG